MCGGIRYVAEGPPSNTMVCHCRTCRRAAASPATVDVTTCSLDDADAFPPTHHSWLSHDLGWVRFGDGLPAFQEFRNDHPG